MPIIYLYLLYVCKYRTLAIGIECLYMYINVPKRHLSIRLLASRDLIKVHKEFLRLNYFLYKSRLNLIKIIEGLWPHWNLINTCFSCSLFVIIATHFFSRRIISISPLFFRFFSTLHLRKCNIRLAYVKRKS